MRASTQVEIRPSTVEELLATAERLFDRHGREIDGRPGKPHRLRYLALERAGTVRALAAWDDGQVVGYSVILIGPQLHHEDEPIVQLDAIYVLPRWRRAGTGMRLLRHSLAIANVEAPGAEVVAHAVPGSAMEQVLLGLGFGVRHIVYGRTG